MFVTGGFLLKSCWQTETQSLREPAELLDDTTVVRRRESAISSDRSSQRARPAHYITNSSLSAIRGEAQQWGTAAPHHTFPCCFSLFSHRQHRIRTECDTYGQGWRRSLVCDLCSTPARCRRPPWACQAGGGTSWWWCRRGEDQEGGCLWKRKKKHKTAR